MGYQRFSKSTITALLIGLFVSALCFVLGFFYPILISKTTVLSFTLNSKSIYLIDTIELFYKEGDWFMVTIIGVTTIIFPVFKYVDLINRILEVIPVTEFYEKLMSQLDKWSMIEVFVIALVILSIKTNSNFMSLSIKSGVYFLCLSVLVRMGISSYLGFRKS